MILRLDQIEAAGGYPIIYADPPWSYNDANCAGRGAATKYQTMNTCAIGDLPIERIAARDSVLFMWGTYPKIADLLELIPRWGFTFKSIAFQWVKTRGQYPDGSDKPFFGLGRWTRGNTEPCFLATRGKPSRISGGVSQIVTTLDEDLVVSPMTRHSAKPPEVRDRIVSLMGDLPRIELFARDRVDGWDAWGNELPNGGDIEMGDSDAKKVA